MCTYENESVSKHCIKSKVGLRGWSSPGNHLKWDLVGGQVTEITSFPQFSPAQRGARPKLTATR